MRVAGRTVTVSADKPNHRLWLQVLLYVSANGTRGREHADLYAPINPIQPNVVWYNGPEVGRKATEYFMTGSN